MIDREKESITGHGVHFLSAGKDKHRRREMERKQRHQREGKINRESG